MEINYENNECKKIIDNLENLKKKLIEIKKEIDDNEILLLNIIEKNKNINFANCC
jgi:hypothetical protein